MKPDTALNNSRIIIYLFCKDDKVQFLKMIT